MKNVSRILKRSILISFGSFLLAPFAIAQDKVKKNEYASKAAESAAVYFISPADNAIVSSPFTIKFGLSAMGVAPAGSNVENTGHHHLLIDLKTLPDMNAPLPANDNVKHFGKGQTETEISLPPGKHTLQLLMGNYVHIPHENPVMSKKITVTVK